MVDLSAVETGPAVVVQLDITAPAIEVSGPDRIGADQSADWSIVTDSDSTVTVVVEGIGSLGVSGGGGTYHASVASVSLPNRTTVLFTATDPVGNSRTVIRRLDVVRPRVHSVLVSTGPAFEVRTHTQSAHGAVSESLSVHQVRTEAVR